MKHKPLEAWQEQRILELAAQGVRASVIAERLGLHSTTVYQIIQKYKKALKADKQ